MTLTAALKRTMIAGLLFAGGITVTVAVGQTTYPPLQVLVSSSHSILGQDIEYPPGKPVFTAAIVTLQPGESTGVHRHEAPLFAMILEGELTVDYGPEGTKVYVKDDALIEAFRTDHNGTNTGSRPVRILAVFAGSEAVKNTVMEK
jgi:quercetin dioxygenase-like cupin family protein